MTNTLSAEPSGIYERPGRGAEPDDSGRTLTWAKPGDSPLEHLGVTGDTYTILLDGDDTAGQYCLIDMHVPKGGGPPPHRHDFEETFVVLLGEIEATFRGRNVTVREGETLHVPANAPHQFTNASAQPARLLCTCSPAGQENLFRAVGVRVEGRTTPPPTPTHEQAQAMAAKAKSLMGFYRTEMLEHA